MIEAYKKFLEDMITMNEERVVFCERQIEIQDNPVFKEMASNGKIDHGGRIKAYNHALRELNKILEEEKPSAP